MAYLSGKFISEEGRLMSVIFEVRNLIKLKGLLLTGDIEEALNIINHSFLLKLLENYGFSQDFLKWMSILLQNQESCDINGGKMRRCSPLKRDTRQGNSIVAYHFIVALETIFIFIKKRENVQGLINQFYIPHMLMTLLFS